MSSSSPRTLDMLPHFARRAVGACGPWVGLSLGEFFVDIPPFSVIRTPHVETLATEHRFERKEAQAKQSRGTAGSPLPAPTPTCHILVLLCLKTWQATFSLKSPTELRNNWLEPWSELALGLPPPFLFFLFLEERHLVRPSQQQQQQQERAPRQFARPYAEGPGLLHRGALECHSGHGG